MLWKFKTYKTNYRENDLGLMKSLEMNLMPTKAITRRLTKLDRPFDLSLHKDRQMIGYNYLEYVR